MDIANIFCQSLGVTSSRENVPYGLPFSNAFGIRSKTANRKERFCVTGHAKELTKYVRYVH